MENEDDVASTRASRDREWPAQHPALDAALVAAIRAPGTDKMFDRQVWARIRADGGGASVPRAERQRRFGAPLWLNVLNVIAVGVVAVMVALALRTAVPPADHSVPVALALIERSPSPMRVVVVAASALGLWLGLRWTPWARAIGLSLGLERVAPRR